MWHSIDISFCILHIPSVHFLCHSNLYIPLSHSILQISYGILNPIVLVLFLSDIGFLSKHLTML